MTVDSGALNDWVENLIGEEWGFTDEQVAQIKAALPDALHFIADLQLIWPAVKPLWPAMGQHIDKLLPVARMVAEVLNRRGTS